jgi:hypothetical protein
MVRSGCCPGTNLVERVTVGEQVCPEAEEVVADAAAGHTATGKAAAAAVAREHRPAKNLALRW